MPTLSDFTRQAMALADYRNLAKENPVPVQVPLGNGEYMIVVVAFMEPNNVTLPFNVSWIVADPASADYRKVLRRTSALPSAKYRNQWAVVTTFEDLVAEPQFWDFSTGFNLGEVEVPQIGAATLDVRGLMVLNRAYAANPASPLVVGGRDSRMSNARTPLPHTHPKLPITMMRGATGVNAYHVNVNTSNSPVAGQILAITGQGAKPGEWLGVWRRPVAADLVYDGATFDEIEINGPAGPIDETIPFQLTADAIFSDGSILERISATWAVIGNSQYANIGASSGILTSLDVDQDQTVRVEARWTHPESGQQRSKFLDVVIQDNTVQINLVSIAITGPNEVMENSIAQFTVTATYDNGTSTGVDPTTFTSSNPGAGTFNSQTGLLTVGELTTSQSTTISATFTYNGVTRTAAMPVECVDSTVYPQSAVIVGPNEVNENSSTNFVMRVTFTNGTQSDVTVNTWTSSDEGAGNINANTGVFQATTNLFEDINTTLSASYSLEGRTVNASRQIKVKDTTVYPRSATILGSQFVNEGALAQYQMSVSFTDDTTAIVSVNNWSLDNAQVGTINAATGQLISAADVPQDTLGTISASYTAHGVTVSDTFDVTIRDTTNYPVSANILGNTSMVENTTQTLQFEVLYLDGTRAVQPVNNWASSNNAAATISAASGVVASTVNTTENVSTDISASWTENGRTVNANMTLTVQDFTDYPVSAVINGPSNINESATGDYVLAVTFNSGVTANRSAQWSIAGTSGASINTTGRVTAPVNVPADVSATVNASFSLDGRTVTAQRVITIKDTTVYPETARIIGANSVEENGTQQYLFEVTFSDATVETVPVTNWASSVPTTAIINANTGMLSALEQTGNATTLITASYTSQGRTVGANLEVTVTDETVYPVSATIAGPATLNEGTSATYQLNVLFSDNTTQAVAVSNWASSNTSYGVINANTGVLAAAANVTENRSLTLSSSYTANGVTVNGSRAITVVDVTAYPVSAEITGPAVVDPEVTQQYELRVTFDDTTTKIVTAETWTRDNAAAGDIDVAGIFASAANTSGANVSTVLTATYVLDGRSVSANRTISVRDLTNYPLSVAVTGPASVQTTDANGAGTGQYIGEVTYQDGTKATPAGTWTVTGASQADPVGTIDANGLFTANQTPGGSTRNITMRFEFTEHGRTVSGTRTVSLVVVPTVSTMEIIGQDSVMRSGSASYTVRATMSDSSTQTVSAGVTWATTAAAGVGTINQSGVFTPNNGLATETTVSISADLTFQGQTYALSKDLTVTVPASLSSITATGPAELESGATGNYVVTAAYSDGSTANVTTAASTTYTQDNAAAGTWSTPKGRYIANSVGSDTATTLTFTHVHDGVTQTHTIELNVKAAVVTGTAMPRWGQAMFADTDFTGGKDPAGDPNYGMPYETWTGIQDFADSVMTNLMPSANDGETFTLNLGNAQYGYYMYPKSLSLDATFTDVGISIPGGMGGASWTPEGEIGTENGPLEVMYDSGDGQGPQPWMIHRTDWDSLGTVTFSVVY